MSTNNFGPGVGASTSLIITPESTLGRFRPGADVGTYGEALDITSESIKHNINELTSATLDPSRGIKDTIRGASDVSGDIAFEFRGQGYGNIIKACMGDGADGSANYLVIDHARGDIAVQVDGYQAIGVGSIPIKCDRSIYAEWDVLWAAPAVGPANGVAVVTRNVAGLLVSNVETVTGMVVNGTQGEPMYRHSITVAGLTLAAVHDNAWIFPVDNTMFPDTYLHYLELGADIREGMNIDVLRDIALFVYTGIKPNTWTMNFNSGEIVNGTFGMVGIKEFCGAELTSVVGNNTAGGLTVQVDDLRIFNNHPTDGVNAVSILGLGGEGQVYYDVLTPDPALGGGATLDASLVHFDYPIPGDITTEAGATGGTAYGTDIISAGIPVGAWPSNAAGEWGWFAGQPCWPMSHRANFGGAVIDLVSSIPDVAPFSYFEARAEMAVPSLVNSGGGILDGRDQGLEFVDVMSANFTVDNGVYTDKYELGSRFRKKAPEQQRNVTGSLSIEFDDMRQYWKFFKGKKFAFLIRCISEDPDRGTVPGATDECPYSACFYLRRCHFTGETPTASGPDMIVTDMPFRSLVYRGIADAVTPYYDKAFTELAVWLTNGRAADLWS